MTREGTHTQLSIEFAAKREVNPHDVADAIYDDFESRTCENCKHWFQAITRDKDNNNTTTPTCMLFAMSDDEYTIFPDKDFGCNKWEAKIVSTDIKS